MNLFFRLITVIEAINLVSGISVKTPKEYVSLKYAAGRVLAEDVEANVDIPGFSRSVKDGYAVYASDCLEASEARPAALTLNSSVQMGFSDPGKIERGEGMYIPTGGQIPEGADAVVMLEYCEEIGDQVMIRRPVAANENIIAKGEDFSCGQGVLTEGKKLKPQDVGILAALGKFEVLVRRRPVLGIISTGVELVSPDTVPKRGEVRDVNSYLCGSFILDKGAVPRYYGIVRDDPDDLIELLNEAANECDAILISGGSSKDRKDITSHAVLACGEILAHGVALAPGKPTIIGRCNNVPVIGIPGHPASVYVILTLFVSRLIEALLGCSSHQELTARATVTKNVHSEKGREEYLRVRLIGSEAIPLFGKSGLINTLVQSDGIIRIPQGSEGFEEGDEYEVIMW